VDVYVRRRLAVLAVLLVVVAGVAALVARGGSGDGGAHAGAATSTTAGPSAARGFLAAADARLRTEGTDLAHACDRSDHVSDVLLRAYGAVFVAGPGVVVPTACRFATTAAVEAFQSSTPTRAQRIGGRDVRLQPAALDALVAARTELRAAGSDLAPRAADAAWRDEAQVEALWRSRVVPALAHWRSTGRITEAEAARIGALSAPAQVGEVLRLEDQGLRFGTDERGPILESVAAPGASQHLAGLAVDVDRYTDPAVVAALGRHGWFRTVLGDEPHFTYLGVPESELPARGLRREDQAGRTYWVPDLG
jgi:hypothetical protein